MRLKDAFLLSVLLIIILMLLTGCSRKHDSKNDIDNGSSSTVKQDNFEITITTSKNIYTIDKIFTTEPLNISATVKYIGDEDKITVWHGDPLCTISLFPKEGESELDEIFLAVKKISIMKKDELYFFSPDFQDEYYKNELAKGQYTAIAHLKLTLDEEGTHTVDFTTEVSFIIK